MHIRGDPGLSPIGGAVPYDPQKLRNHHIEEETSYEQLYRLPQPQHLPERG